MDAWAPLLAAVPLGPEQAAESSAGGRGRCGGRDSVFTAVATVAVLGACGSPAEGDRIAAVFAGSGLGAAATDFTAVGVTV
mmetsp:Transcript_89791/g.290591  ORF Transcript_89791/g.290591 Transcript_89791/m.290591 type:complete len:81 (-) Transcript_89791:202-444(-)